MSSPWRLTCLRARHALNWRMVRLLALFLYTLFMVFVIVNLLNMEWSSEGESGHAHGRKKSHGRRAALGPVPDEILAFEAKFEAGLAENGRGVPIDSATDVDAILKKYAFNKLASDRVSLKRKLPDVRHSACLGVNYDRQLPSTSVIIIFNNEILSTLLRTVWSVILTSPRQHLHEVILVDDASNLTEITHTLPLYIEHRLPPGLVRLHVEPKQRGLIGARLAGAKLATGDAIIFLDSHCEASRGWLEPLLQRIKDNPTIVVIPQIDSISDRTLEFYGHPGGTSISVGGFTWSGHFTWIGYRHNATRKASDPAETATMAGGLFGADRKFFFHVGGYDEGMTGWGGENLELSFRVWRCGGSMEIIPCSHVGHIFRSWHPYFIPHDSHGINTARMAEVWMDDYKRMFYMHRADLARDLPHPVDIGDLGDRLALKKKLQCKSFKWFLDNIYPDKFVLDEQSSVFGRFRSRRHRRICFDHLQRDHAHKLTYYLLGQYPCHGVLGDSQYFSLSLTGQLRNEYMCAEGPAKAASPASADVHKVSMHACSDGARAAAANHRQQWEADERGVLRHKTSGLCITSPNEKAGEDLELRKCDGSLEQQWEVEFRNDKPRP